MINPEVELIFFEKSTNKVQKIVIVDDLYELCDNRFLNGGTEIFEDMWMPYPLLATDIKSKAEEILGRDDISKEVKERVADLNSMVTIDSNPVILLFTLKDKIDL